jgi:hypothetical protein
MLNCKFFIRKLVPTLGPSRKKEETKNITNLLGFQITTPHKPNTLLVGGEEQKIVLKGKNFPWLMIILLSSRLSKLSPTSSLQIQSNPIQSTPSHGKYKCTWMQMVEWVFNDLPRNPDQLPTAPPAPQS